MSASVVLDMQGDRLHGQRYAFYFQYQEKEAFLPHFFYFTAKSAEGTKDGPNPLKGAYGLPVV